MGHSLRNFRETVCASSWEVARLLKSTVVWTQRCQNGVALTTASRKRAANVVTPFRLEKLDWDGRMVAAVLGKAVLLFWENEERELTELFSPEDRYLD